MCFTCTVLQTSSGYSLVTVYSCVKACQVCTIDNKPHDRGVRFIKFVDLGKPQSLEMVCNHLLQSPNTGLLQVTQAS